VVEPRDTPARHRSKRFGFHRQFKSAFACRAFTSQAKEPYLRRRSYKVLRSTRLNGSIGPSTVRSKGAKPGFPQQTASRLQLYLNPRWDVSRHRQESHRVCDHAPVARTSASITPVCQRRNRLRAGPSMRQARELASFGRKSLACSAGNSGDDAGAVRDFASKKDELYECRRSARPSTQGRMRLALQEVK